MSDYRPHLSSTMTDPPDADDRPEPTAASLPWNESNPEWWKVQVEDRGEHAWPWLVNEWEALAPAPQEEPHRHDPNECSTCMALFTLGRDTERALTDEPLRAALTALRYLDEQVEAAGRFELREPVSGLDIGDQDPPERAVAMIRAALQASAPTAQPEPRKAPFRFEPEHLSDLPGYQPDSESRAVELLRELVAFWDDPSAYPKKINREHWEVLWSEVRSFLQESADPIPASSEGRESE